MEENFKEINYVVSDMNEIIDKSTGEVISVEDLKRAKQTKAIEKVQEANKELKELGVTSNLIVCEWKGEVYNCVSVKPNHQFDKMFRTSMQNIIKNEKLSLTGKALLLTIIPFIVFPSNIVSIKGCNTIEDIGELTGLKPSTTYKAFKELIDKEIVHKVKKNGQTLIYVNPFLVASGLIISKTTIDYFKDSKYAK